jgi:hypothetical protein
MQAGCGNHLIPLREGYADFHRVIFRKVLHSGEDDAREKNNGFRACEIFNNGT